MSTLGPTTIHFRFVCNMEIVPSSKTVSIKNRNIKSNGVSFLGIRQKTVTAIHTTTVPVTIGSIFIPPRPRVHSVRILRLHGIVQTSKPVQRMMDIISSWVSDHASKGFYDYLHEAMVFTRMGIFGNVWRLCVLASRSMTKRSFATRDVISLRWAVTNKPQPNKTCRQQDGVSDRRCFLPITNVASYGDDVSNTQTRSHEEF